MAVLVNCKEKALTKAFQHANPQMSPSLIELQKTVIKYARSHYRAKLSKLIQIQPFNLDTSKIYPETTSVVIADQKTVSDNRHILFCVAQIVRIYYALWCGRLLIRMHINLWLFSDAMLQPRWNAVFARISCANEVVSRSRLPVMYYAITLKIAQTRAVKVYFQTDALNFSITDARIIVINTYFIQNRNICVASEN